MRLSLRWLGVLGTAGLTGCADLTGFGFSDPAVTRLPLVGGAVIGAGPPGYCFEPRVSQPQTGFGVMASCTVLAGDGDLSEPNGFITVQVGAAGSGLGADISDLPTVLQSDTGRALLSSSGEADLITVQEAGSNANSATVRFLDQGAPPVAGLQQTEWRGFLDIGGRLTTVSVRGLAAAPLGTDEGLILLEQVMQALRQANPPG